MPSASGRCDRLSWLRGWLPVIVALTGTFISSSIPGYRLPPLGEWSADKILHGIGYAVIGALFLRPLGRTSWGTRRPMLAVLVATALASAWGVLDELHQLFTPNRSCDWRDWIADTVGAFVGALAFLGVVRARLRRSLGSSAPTVAGGVAPGGAGARGRIARDGATENAATENAATESAATENAATENAATENAATENAATENAATENAATENAATEKAIAGIGAQRKGAP